MDDVVDERSGFRAVAPPPRLLRGFAPAVLAVVLFLLMMASVPSVAPEEIVRTPVAGEAGE